jgi:flagellar biogenesis protein FliO
MREEDIILILGVIGFCMWIFKKFTFFLFGIDDVE